MIEKKIQKEAESARLQWIFGILLIPYPNLCDFEELSAQTNLKKCSHRKNFEFA